MSEKQKFPQKHNHFSAPQSLISVHVFFVVVVEFTALIVQFYRGEARLVAEKKLRNKFTGIRDESFENLPNLTVAASQIRARIHTRRGRFALGRRS